MEEMLPLLIKIYVIGFILFVPLLIIRERRKRILARCLTGLDILALSFVWPIALVIAVLDWLLSK